MLSATEKEVGCLRPYTVSILVLMECSPQPWSSIPIIPALAGFNPCFNGMLSATQVANSRFWNPICFNPCFNGMLSATFYIIIIYI